MAPVDALKIYNSLTRKKEIIKPIQKGKIGFYSCGQTIYDDLHIGHIRTYGYWDIVTRYLRHLGYEVTHVQNFTDVGHLTSDEDYGEDKIEKRAKERKVDPWQLVEYYIKRYFEDMDALHMMRADIYPRATQHIKEMIELNKKIEKNGYTYYVNGNLYFDTQKFTKYKTLFHIKKGGEEHRVEQDKNKKNPEDFVLWFSDEKHLMKWKSPWGTGYPGWHIECSAMSMKYLGENFDIHSGGYDHLFIHHPNEIAQAEASGAKFANYWMHAHFLTVNGEKMSKSKGNFITARELLEKYDWETIRMFMASAHYRKPVDFNENAVKEAQDKLDKLYETITLAEESKEGSKKELHEIITTFWKNYEEAMNDDLNTAKAISELLQLSKKINTHLDNDKVIINEAVKALKQGAGILGVELNKKIRIGRVEFTGKEETGNWKELTKQITTQNMRKLLKIRQAYRKGKDYKTSDKIRETLKEKGITIEDYDNGAKWRIR